MTEGDCDPSALSDSATRTVIRGPIAAEIGKAYARFVRQIFLNAA